MVRYLDRTEKWLVHAKIILYFRYMVISTRDEAQYQECIRHWEYENEHWEKPPGNDKLEKAPLKKKIQLEYGIEIEKLAQGIAKGDYSATEVVKTLDIPESLIKNLLVYYTPV